MADEMVGVSRLISAQRAPGILTTRWPSTGLAPMRLAHRNSPIVEKPPFGEMDHSLATQAFRFVWIVA